MASASLSFRYLESLCGNDSKNYTRDKDFRRWLQKALYYAQCYLLNTEGKVLVNDSFENHCFHGPMVYSLHETLKRRPTTNELSALDSMSHVDLLDAVAIVLEEYSGEELVDFSHCSQPYLDTKFKAVISIDKMKNDFGKNEFERNFISRVKEELLEIEKQNLEMDVLLPDSLYDSSRDWKVEFDEK